MKTKYGRVAVLMGGWSAERLISLTSGRAVLEALQNAGVDAFGVDARSSTKMLEILSRESFDCAFVAMHGRGGEDGVVQGALEMMRTPYTGSRFAAAVLCMNKVASKRLWRDAGLPTPGFRVMERGFRASEIIDELGTSLYVKPVTEGSSIGVTRVTEAAQMGDAFRKAGGPAARVFAERAMEGGEYTVGFVGDRWLTPIKIETPRAFYDYTAKYESRDTRYICPAGLTEERTRKLVELAQQGARTLGASGWGRVDFVCDDAGDFHLLELNVTPGLTEHSLVPKAAAFEGMDFTALVTGILDEALRETSATEEQDYVGCA